MAHIWWECPKIKKCWTEVLLQIKDITNITVEIPEDPWVCLFHGTENPIKHYKNSMMPHLMNAVKRLIP